MLSQEPLSLLQTTAAPGSPKEKKTSSSERLGPDSEQETTHVLILYTTLYREGGPKFARAAATLAKEKRAEYPNLEVVCRAIESKQDFIAAFSDITKEQGLIEEFHFIGHSGVYGIMFGTTEWPEQFSPYEWRALQLPLSSQSRCYFHACRTGRWFAPFFARTFGVKAYGHHWYTTLSKSSEKFIWEGPNPQADKDLYVISCPGKKSHGVLASAFKYTGLTKAIPMLEFCPTRDKIDTTYDSVAGLYDDTFEDIGVRRDEWQWLVRNLGDASEKALLDIGCGNGAFLSKLAPGLGTGVGVDISAGMLEQARKRNASHANLSFEKIDGPQLPFADNSFDVVMSILSFRYLDWDPVVQEILRVLKPGGQVIVIDMVASPVKLKEAPQFVKDKCKAYGQRLIQPGYFKALRRMVTDDRWKTMLKYNPIRSEHEMRWYLESRFAGRKVETINMGWSSRILAFNSGPVHFKTIEKLTYP